MKEKALKRIDVLLSEYEELRKKSKYDDLSGGCTDTERKAFSIRAASAILSIAPEDSPCRKQVYSGSGNIVSIPYLMGIMHALRTDIEDGHIEIKDSQIISDVSSEKRAIPSLFLDKFHSWNLRTEIKVALIGLVGVVLAAIITGAFFLIAACVPVLFNSKDTTESKSVNYQVSSNNQMGGVTAGVVNLKKPARHLNEKLKLELLAWLPEDKSTIILNVVMNDNEAALFATEVENFLLEEGWKVQKNPMMVFIPPFTGQRLHPHDDGEIRIDIGSRE